MSKKEKKGWREESSDKKSSDEELEDEVIGIETESKLDSEDKGKKKKKKGL